MILKVADPEWKAIHRIADRLAPELQAEFLAAFETLRRLLPLNQLTELIEAEAFTEIGVLIQGLKLPDPKPIQVLLQTAAVQTGKITATGLNLSFTLDNPAVVRWVEENTAQLFLQVTGETKKAVANQIAGIVREGFIEGIPPRTQARQMRRIVGLTSQQSDSVKLFLDGQLKAGISAKRADMMADRMRDRLIKFRAETIARTESIRAANQGQLQAWRDAADEGLLDPTITKRVWIATLDDRTCGICAALDGDIVGFDKEFVSRIEYVDFTDEGDSFVEISSKPLIPPVVEMAPPAHPRCRCSSGLVFDEAEVTTEQVVAPADETADAFVQRMETAHPEAQIDFYERSTTDSEGNRIARLSRIVIPEEQRGTGLGTQFMESVTEWADATKHTVELSPSSDFGGNKARLQVFYRRFGFVANKGRNKDFTISDTMYRLPRT